MTNRTYSEETKTAVRAALLTGQSVSSVAKEYKIPKGTVKGWSAQLRKADLVEPQKKGEIGTLLLAYLRENLATLQVQAAHFRNEGWLDKQDAADLAVLHGVMTDKAVRLLEALSNAPGD